MRYVIVFTLILLPTVASSQVLTIDDLQAAIADKSQQITALSDRSAQLAIQLARANREIADLKAAADKAKTPNAVTP